jgi:Protein of unknown function (DUF3303)
MGRLWGICLGVPVCRVELLLGAGRDSRSEILTWRAKMVFMVIERYKNRDAKAVYSRFKEKGRMMPDGLKYLGSWVEDNFDRCFQLMECDDPHLFEQWLVHWRDLGDYEIVHVVSSAEAADAALSERALPHVEL